MPPGPCDVRREAFPPWTHRSHPRHLRLGMRMLCPRLRSDPSQSDPETKDFWLNMAALTEALQHQAEQNPTASYYNLVLLRYQVGSGGGRGNAAEPSGEPSGEPASALLPSAGRARHCAGVPVAARGADAAGWGGAPPGWGTRRCRPATPRLLIPKFSRPGPESVPLQMSAHWQCGPTLTRVTVEYSYRAGATAVSTPLTNVQILLPVGEPVASVRLQPAASW